MKIFLITLTIISSSLFFIPANLFASPISFSINPQKFELDVFPGENFHSKIKITNRNEFALPISVQTLTFDAAEDTGAMIFMPPGDLENSPGRWFQFGTPDFILEPGESREINFEINIPQEAKPGGYSAFTLFEPRLPEHYFEERAAARAIPVLGAPFLISVKSFYLDPEPRDELEIVEFSLSPEDRLAFPERVLGVMEGAIFRTVEAGVVQAVDRKPQSFNLRVRNNSDFHLKPRGRAVIKNIFGRTVGEIEIPERTILPGKIRILPVEFTPEKPASVDWLPDGVSEYLADKVFAGRYRVELDLSSPHLTGFDTLEARASGGMVLYSLPWVTVLAVFLVLILVILTLFRHRRFKLVFKAFLKGSK